MHKTFSFSLNLNKTGILTGKVSFSLRTLSQEIQPVADWNWLFRLHHNTKHYVFLVFKLKFLMSSSTLCFFFFSLPFWWSVVLRDLGKYQQSPTGTLKATQLWNSLWCCRLGIFPMVINPAWSYLWFIYRKCTSRPKNQPVGQIKKELKILVRRMVLVSRNIAGKI